MSKKEDAVLAAAESAGKRRSSFAEVWKRLRKNKLSMTCLIIVCILILVAIFAEQIVPYSLAVTSNASAKFAKPSAEHWFGCDNLGRDLFARVIHGSRISLILGFAATFFSTIIASLLGASAAFIGGRYDTVVTTIIDILISIPSILLSLAISAGFGVGVPQLIVAITVGQIPGFTRIVRSTVLGIANQEYIEAARAIGVSNFDIIVRHILPNALGTILVQATMQVSSGILSGAMLGFLGLGAPIPTPEWGIIMSDGLAYIRYVTHIVVFPTIFISVTALSINILGDGLRDAFDPRLKGRA